MNVTSSSLAHIAEVSRRQFAINSERSRLMPVESISTNTAIAGKYFTPKHQLRPMPPIPRTELCLSFSLLIRAWSNPFEVYKDEKGFELIQRSSTPFLKPVMGVVL